MRCIVTILATLLLVSCSVKKRTFRDGYYVDWAFKKKKGSGNISVPVKVASVKADDPIEVIIVSSSNDIDVSLTSVKKIILPGDTCGDLITLRSGDQVMARVVEITEDKIKYKRCDNLEGPMFVVNKATVSSIRYSNGTLEKIEASTEPVNTTQTNSRPKDKDAFYAEQKVHPLAGWALVAWLIGAPTLTLGYIAALIMSNKAIRDITLQPKKWRGLQLAQVVRALSIVCLTLCLIGLIALIAA